MTTNLKIHFWNNNSRLNPIPDTNNFILWIELRDELQVWDNNRDAKVFNFPIDLDPNNNINLDRIYYIQITGPTNTLNTIYKLFSLKEELRNIAENNNFYFQLVNINKNLGNQNDSWNIRQNPHDNNLILDLTTDDFGNDLNNVIIDDVDYEIDGIKHGEDYSNEKQALLDLERTLKNLEIKYTKGMDFKEGPDFDLIEPTELGKPNIEGDTDPSRNREATGLQAYKYSKDNTIKNILYNLNGGIDFWIQFLKKIRHWHKRGIRKKSEIFLLYQSGYDESDEEKEETKKQLGFYKGFPLLDPNLKVTLNPDNNKFEVEKRDPDKVVRYTKENIDIFRSPTPGYTGANNDIFTKKKLDKDRRGKDIEVFANSKPEECLGFQPGDFSEINNNKLLNNGSWYFSGRSKILYDILSAQNVDEAMNLAFFGKDYDFAQSDYSPDNRKNHPKNNWVKTPNTNLKFNEVKDWDRKETLEHYYQAFSVQFDNGIYCCKWRIPGDDTGYGATDAPKWDDPYTQQKITEGYELAEKWIGDYETYLGLNFNSESIANLNVIKNDLEKWKKTRIYKTEGGAWVQVINNFLDEIDGAIHHVNFETELAGLKNRGSKLAQKIYQNLKANEGGFTKEIFAELKNLVNLLDKAFETTVKDSTKNELNNFVNSSDANKKAALKIARSIKNQESDLKNCVDTALEKLKSPQENKLEEARQNLKDLLNGRKTGGKDVYPLVVADIQNSETDLNKAREIFEKLKEIEEANEDDNGELLNALNNLKNDTSNQNAWNAINKYIKDGQSQGFADEMLKKLKDWDEKRKESHYDIQNAKTKAEFQVAKKLFISKTEYRNNKEDYDEIYFPLLEKSAEIKEKENNVNEEEKKLSQLITVIMTDYNDWKTQLEDLETKLNQIRDYTEGGAKHNIIQNYSEPQKIALTKLISKMESKVQEWKTLKNSSENNNSSPLPWYQTTAGIVGIILFSVAIIGGIIYYYLVKSKEEGEEKE